MLQNLPASSRLAEVGKGRTKDQEPLDQAVGGLHVALSTSTNRKTVRSQRFVVYYLILCTLIFALSKTLNCMDLLAWEMRIKSTFLNVPKLCPLQDCHNRAWEAVAQFLEQNLGTFAGRVADAESTIMPSSRAWLRELIQKNTTSVDCGGTKKRRIYSLIHV